MPSSAAEHRFGSTPPYTLGVEEEYMLLNPDGLDLIDRVEMFLEAAHGGEFAGSVSCELFQSEVEVHTPVCANLSQLDRDFATSEQGERDGLSWLRLKSKDKEPQFAYADLGFDAGGLTLMRFEDTLGDRTEIRFSDWKRNPQLPGDAFKFTPPKGVDIVGDPTPTAEAHPVKD